MTTPTELALRRVLGARDWGSLVSISEDGTQMTLIFDRLNGKSRVELLLPGAQVMDAPWNYAEPRDLDDWAGMLGIWLDEEFLRDVVATDESRVLVPSADGQSLVPQNPS